MARVRKGDLLIRTGDSPSLEPDLMFSKCAAARPPEGYRVLVQQQHELKLKHIKEWMSLMAADAWCYYLICEKREELRRPERWARICPPTATALKFRGFAHSAERITWHLDTVRRIIRDTLTEDPQGAAGFLNITNFYSHMRWLGRSRSLRLSELAYFLTVLDFAIAKASDLGTLRLLNPRTWRLQSTTVDVYRWLLLAGKMMVVWTRTRLIDEWRWEPTRTCLRKPTNSCAQD
jgi:hypothetical protein